MALERKINTPVSSENPFLFKKHERNEIQHLQFTPLSNGYQPIIMSRVSYRLANNKSIAITRLILTQSYMRSVPRKVNTLVNPPVVCTNFAIFLILVEHFLN